MTADDYTNIQRMIDESIDHGELATQNYVNNSLEDLERDLRNEIPDDNINGLQNDLSDLQNRVWELENTV
jgi:hypothetical protein